MGDFTPRQEEQQVTPLPLDQPHDLLYRPPHGHDRSGLDPCAGQSRYDFLKMAVRLLPPLLQRGGRPGGEHGGQHQWHMEAPGEAGDIGQDLINLRRAVKRD